MKNVNSGKRTEQTCKRRGFYQTVVKMQYVAFEELWKTKAKNS